MIEGILLVAGTSERMGDFKMSLKLGEKTLIERSLEPMLQVCSRVIVVGGFKFDEIRKTLFGYKNLDLIFNDKFENGMFTSIKKGSSLINSEYFYLMPGDMPLIKPETFKKLSEFESEIILPTYKKKTGHPVLLHKNLIPEILKEPDTSSLKNIIERKGFLSVEIDDEGVLIDIDTWEDYKIIQERFS